MNACIGPITVSRGWERRILSGETERWISSSDAPKRGIGPGALARRDVRGLGTHSWVSSVSTRSFSVAACRGLPTSFHSNGMVLSCQRPPVQNESAGATLAIISRVIGRCDTAGEYCNQYDSRSAGTENPGWSAYWPPLKRCGQLNIVTHNDEDSALVGRKDIQTFAQSAAFASSDGHRVQH
jgi:hypothetical protein